MIFGDRSLLRNRVYFVSVITAAEGYSMKGFNIARRFVVQRLLRDNWYFDVDHQLSVKSGSV